MSLNANTRPSNQAISSGELFQIQQHRAHSWADRFFLGLMLVQFLGLMATAAWISPLTWSGTNSSIHQHVWAALLIGGPITLFPAFLAWKLPGSTLTRFSIAIGQMFVSALLIHLTGGRVESHFHIFGSLAFLAIYRDWRLIVVATVVTAGDHLIRAAVWPQSLLGLEHAAIWRALEHAGWVIFEDVVLLVSIRQSVTETRRLCSTISEVAVFSERVGQSSSQLNATSELLADGGAEQQGGIQTISSAIKHLTDKTGSIQHVLEELEASAANARSLAEQGAAAAGQTDQLMRMIESASREMATVVNEVQKVSEQTNLLALNATIEASRAGAAGRGFAVVATEVKDLANRSQDLSSRVTALITDSISRATEGVIASEESREHLHGIIASVDATVGQIRDILTATEFQTDAVIEVSGAVSSMASISAQVAKTSEDMSSSSRTLKLSAEQLTAIVASFCEESSDTTVRTSSA